MGGVRKAFLWPRIIRGVARRKSATGRFLQAHRFSQSAHLQVRTQGYVLHVPLKQMNICLLFISACCLKSICYFLAANIWDGIKMESFGHTFPLR